MFVWDLFLVFHQWAIQMHIIHHHHSIIMCDPLRRQLIRLGDPLNHLIWMVLQHYQKQIQDQVNLCCSCPMHRHFFCFQQLQHTQILLPNTLLFCFLELKIMALMWASFLFGSFRWL